MLKSHSINKEAKLSTQQHKLQIYIHHSPLKHLGDYLQIQKLSAVICTYFNSFALFYNDPELSPG